MISRRNVLKGAAAVSMPRRPDQQYDPPGVLVAAGGRSGILRARKVIVVGPSGSGVFVYSPTAAAGNLIASIAAAAGTDPYGNAYRAGITTYGTGVAAGQVAELFNGSLLLNNGANSSDGQLFASTGAIALLCPKENAGDVGPELSLNSQVESGITGGTWGANALLDLTAGLAISDSAAPAVFASHVQPFSSTGALNALDANDANQYDTERRTLYTTGPQTINSTADALITGLSIPVTARRYEISGTIKFTENVTDAANNPVFAFHGPGLTDASLEYSEFLVGGAGGVITIVGSAFGNVTLTAFASHQQVLKVSGLLNFSAAGTLSLQAHTTLAADTFTISQDSRLDVMPVST